MLTKIEGREKRSEHVKATLDLKKNKRIHVIWTVSHHVLRNSPSGEGVYKRREYSKS